MRTVDELTDVDEPAWPESRSGPAAAHTGLFSASVPFSARAATPAQVDPPYGSGKEAHADGAYNIKKGDPGYRPKLDRDNDGVACEG
ncbi:excalibur calcium-binding domain-containing protein [Mycobacterium sp. NPDC050853]|uniref:excalibur calcium-binding domain-containing protein n=1 Tax=Mycobacteriaceae TaxID=1762 RepID=UPI002104AA1A